MSHNNQKKIALINDFTGFGRCSIAVALPVISMLKVQCCPLPTSVLSNHTGFESFFFDDYTEKMTPYIAEWKKLGLQFDGICSGFLGSIVLGFPKNMNNTIGERAEKSLAFKEMLERRTGLPVVMWDERLTTVAANRTLIEGGVRRENRKDYVDMLAAVYILQGYLDSRERTSNE